ncbi:MAG TPA: hypothetical protein VK003_17665 [Oceanobacillus sp.]|nr:hypothetical protein [Oceanobacillus sp.]
MTNFTYDPFQEFINNHLNLDDLEGVNLEAVVSSMRETLARLANASTDNLWADHLTSVQDMVRLCLSTDMILDLLPEKPDLSGIDRADLELFIMLAVSVGFICQNDMVTEPSEPALECSDLLMARRLRTMLKSAMGWVKKAADEGDPVAEVMCKEATELLVETEQFE